MFPAKGRGHRVNDGLIIPIPWERLGSESAKWLRGVDLQGYTRPNDAEAANQHGLWLEVIKHPIVERGFLLPAAGWSNEASHGPRVPPARTDYERLDTTLKEIHPARPRRIHAAKISAALSNEAA
ncbi:MAG TPA: hypothetical protein VK638_37295 [Edaphobacter sp.]|nr:hypothetical protein [Edaphobacter sp.]